MTIGILIQYEPGQVIINTICIMTDLYFKNVKLAFWTETGRFPQGLSRSPTIAFWQVFLAKIICHRVVIDLEDFHAKISLQQHAPHNLLHTPSTASSTSVISNNTKSAMSDHVKAGKDSAMDMVTTVIPKEEFIEDTRKWLLSEAET
jgi:hypothetical protein